MSREGRGCLVGDQGGSDKVAQFKIEGLRSRDAVPPLDPRMYLFTEGLETKWDFKFYKFYFAFEEHIVQTLYRKQH